MQFLKKIRIPLIIFILLVLVVLSIIIVRNILTVAGRADEALDFASEMPTNLDNIFTGDFLDEELEGADTLEDSSDEELFSTNVTNANDKSVEVSDDEIVEIVPKQEVVVAKDEEPKAFITTDTVAATTTATKIETVPASTTTLVEPKEKEVRITKLIVDQHTASKKSPSYMTIIFNADENVEYASVKVFARRLARNNEILSRELVFGLPKVYIVNGQGQTQFYFAGRYAGGSNKYIRDGRYIMYVEVIGYDKDGNRVSGTGQYPMPKFDNVITLNN